MVDTVLVVAAHADDEVLGCGGTLVRHTMQGDAVHVAYVADGVSSRGGTETLSAREDAARCACRVLGASEPVFLNYLDNRLDTVALLDITQSIEKVVADIDPDIIYTHHSGDLNVDHRITHQAVMTACRPQPGARLKKILSFEVPSSTEWQSVSENSHFSPTFFVDILPAAERKKEALECYASELRNYPHSRSMPAIDVLARYRGSSVGMEMAEAFMLIRELVRAD